MKGAERQVAVAARSHDDAEAVDVERVGEGLVLLAHLVVDAVDRLVAPEYSAGNARLGERGFGVVEDLLKEFAAVLAGLEDVFVKDLIAKRVAVRKRKFLKLAENVVEAEPVRDRNIDFKGLSTDAGALLGPHDAERAHVVEAVGELHENDADVARHGKEHLPEAFGLGDCVGRELQLIELGDAVNEVRDFNPELLGHLALARPRVFEHVVHEARFNRLGIHAPGGEDRGDRDRMRDVGFARFAELTEVGIVGVAVGSSDFLDFSLREVEAAGVDERLGGHDADRRLGRKERKVGIGELRRNDWRGQGRTDGMLGEPEGRNRLPRSCRKGGGTFFAGGVHVFREGGRVVEGHGELPLLLDACSAESGTIAALEAPLFPAGGSGMAF